MNLIILGPQGCGKGTQADILAQRFNLEHIEMGNILREVAKMDTPLGKKVYNVQNVEKGLVSDEIFSDVLRLELNSLAREQGLILDGAPRNLKQARIVENLFQESGRMPDAVIFVNISEKESIERISKRWVCEKCKKILIMGVDIKSKEDKCPACGGSISQRKDDTEEGVKKRLAIFRKDTLPVIDYFRKKGMMIEINGEQEIEKVEKDILEALKSNKLIEA